MGDPVCGLRVAGQERALEKLTVLSMLDHDRPGVRIAPPRVPGRARRDQAKGREHARVEDLAVEAGEAAQRMTDVEGACQAQLPGERRDVVGGGLYRPVGDLRSGGAMPAQIQRV